MADTTNTTTVSDSELRMLYQSVPAHEATVKFWVESNETEYVLPTVPYMPDQHPVTSLAAAVVRLHQRVEALEATVAELKGEDRG